MKSYAKSSNIASPNKTSVIRSSERIQNRNPKLIPQISAGSIRVNGPPNNGLGVKNSVSSHNLNEMKRPGQVT